MPTGVKLQAGTTVKINPSSPYFPSYCAKVGTGGDAIYVGGYLKKPWSPTAGGYSDGMVIFYFNEDGTFDLWAMDPAPGHLVYGGTWQVVA